MSRPYNPSKRLSVFYGHRLAIKNKIVRVIQCRCGAEIFVEFESTRKHCTVCQQLLSKPKGKHGNEIDYEHLDRHTKRGRLTRQR